MKLLPNKPTETMLQAMESAHGDKLDGAIDEEMERTSGKT